MTPDVDPLPQEFVGDPHDRPDDDGIVDLVDVPLAVAAPSASPVSGAASVAGRSAVERQQVPGTHDADRRDHRGEPEQHPLGPPLEVQLRLEEVAGRGHRLEPVVQPAPRREHLRAGSAAPPTAAQDREHDERARSSPTVPRGGVACSPSPVRLGPWNV